ncbi:MAG: GAF domain-containing protein [Candidatus Delongbacteria bacterium]|nr:GAF domain-containing protein [Candidatus Delongbacteria bacterium]
MNDVRDEKRKISASDSDIFSISSEESFFNNIAEIEDLRSVVPTHEETANKKLQEVLSVTEKLMTTYNKDEIFDLIISKSIRLTGAERGYLILIGDNNELEVSYALKMDSESPEDSLKEISSTVINKVISDKEVIIVKDALKDQEYEVKRSIINLKLKSIMCVPMIKEDVVIGIIYVENRTIPGIFNSESGEILKFFGNQCAVALENLDLLEENKRYALTLEKQVQERTSELEYEKSFVEKIIDNVGEILITVNQDLIIQKSNIALKLLGMNSKNIKGMHLSQFYESESFKKIEEAILGGKNASNISCYIKNIDGIKIHFSATITHITENGKISSSIIINKDMTEVEKYENERLAKNALESITKAAVTANDQINTPLGVIIGRATILSSFLPEDSKFQKNLEIIKEQSYRIKETLNEMKEITKIEDKDYKLDGIKMINLDQKK